MDETTKKYIVEAAELFGACCEMANEVFPSKGEMFETLEKGDYRTELRAVATTIFIAVRQRQAEDRRRN